VYGELLLNEMWRKYVGGNSTTKNELAETLVDLFSKLQRFRLITPFHKKTCHVLLCLEQIGLVLSEDWMLGCATYHVGLFHDCQRFYDCVLTNVPNNCDKFW